MVTLKQIEAAHWVEKLGSFHAAAERLNTTQSTISKRIQELEQSLGFPIFDRTNKSTQVTLKGRGFIEDFAAMLALHRKIRHRAESDESYSGHFHLGATEMVSLTWLPALIRAIKARFPNINLTTSINLANTLHEKFQAYRFDLVLCPASRESEAANVHVLALPALESAWMCSPAMAAGRHGLLTAEDIAKLPLLTYAEGSLLHQTVSKALGERGLVVRHAVSCSSMIALAELVRGGLGIAYLPRDYFQPYGGGLAVLHTDLTMRPLQYAALYRDDFIAAQIAGMAQQYCNFGVPEI